MLSWALNSFAANDDELTNNSILKANIISFALDPKLSLLPRAGEVTIENEAIVLEIDKTGLTCLSTNCKTSNSVQQFYKAPIVEIYQDECRNIHYRAYGSDALVNDQEIFIEVVDYENSICPIFISDAPTQIILKTTYKNETGMGKTETFSEMMAEVLIEKKNPALFLIMGE